MKTFNMETRNIIDTLNSFINKEYPENKGFFILKKTITDSPIAKAYKQYDYCLCHKFNKDITIPIRVNHTSRVVGESDKKEMETIMSSKLLDAIFDMINDNNLLNSIVDGTFSNYRNSSTDK